MRGSTFCVRLCPASSSGARRPPASSPRARRGHVRCPPPRASSSPSRRLPYLFLVAVAVGHDGEGDDARGGEYDARGGAARPEEDERGDDGAGRRRLGAQSHT